MTKVQELDTDSDDSGDVMFDVRHVYQEQEEALLPNDASKDKRVQKLLNGSNTLTGQRSTRYPKSVFLILGTEFCERFNYYGMRTILVIYLTEWHGQSYDSSVALFHLFGMLAYFSPVLGAIIADGYLGRYRTILYVSMVYAAGTLVLSLTAFPPPELYGPIFGLLLISLGTGGIKPCVTAFGGDQFTDDQEKERMAFFSAFYFMINLGSTLSTLLTPILRADVHCIENSCYPLAFGVPTILMVISLIIFASGGKSYRHLPPTGNLFGRVACCVWDGAMRRLKGGKKEGFHWLDHASGQYEKEFVSDVKVLLKVLWLFLPLPVFWALFDQQGSRWTLQAVQMNGQMGSLGRIKPDQMQVLNPILILLLIPLFDRIIYPCLDWANVPNRPLQRMCTGMVLCSAAFFIAGFVQIKIENSLEPPLAGKSGITMMNVAECTTEIDSAFYKDALLKMQMTSMHRVDPDKDLRVKFRCLGQHVNKQFPVVGDEHITAGQAYILVIYMSAVNTTALTIFPDSRERDKDGHAKVSLIVMVPDGNPTGTSMTYSLLKLEGDKVEYKPVHTADVQVNNASDYFVVEPGRYQVMVNEDVSEGILHFGSGSINTVVVLPSQNSTEKKTLRMRSVQFETMPESQVSIFWLVPQYVVITCGEILFSITGLAFAYSQAPSTMKSVLQAAWLLTVAFGDLIVVIVAETRLVPKQSSEFFMFACLMVVTTGAFGLMAYFYSSTISPGLEASRVHIDDDHRGDIKELLTRDNATVESRDSIEMEKVVRLDKID